MEPIVKTLTEHGLPGVAILVLLYACRHLYLENRRLRDDRTAALEAVTKAAADEQRVWRERQHEQNLAMRRLVRSLTAKLRKHEDDDSDGGEASAG